MSTLPGELPAALIRLPRLAAAGEATPLQQVTPDAYTPGDLTHLPTANVTTPDPILVADVHYQYTPLFFNFLPEPLTSGHADYGRSAAWIQRPRRKTVHHIRSRQRGRGRRPMSLTHRFSRITSMARDKRGGVALMFGAMLLPTLMVVGFAVDYSFYVQAQSQLNLGADAAALHAVRAASSAFSSSGTRLRLCRRVRPPDSNGLPRRSAC